MRYAILISFLLALPCWATTYHMSTTGNDTNAFAAEGSVTEVAGGSSDTGVQVIIVITGSIPILIVLRRKDTGM